MVCAAGAWSARLLRPLGLRLPQRWVRATVARTTPAPPLTRAGVWGPAVSFRQRRDGTLNLAAAGAADHDVTLDSLRHARLFWPNYWKNRKLFRFHVGRPLLRSLAGLLPGSAARRNPLTWDRGLGPAPNPAKVERSLQELRRLYPALGELAGHAELGGLHRRHAGRDPGDRRGGAVRPRRRDRLHGPRLRDGADRGPAGRRARSPTESPRSTSAPSDSRASPRARSGSLAASSSLRRQRRGLTPEFDVLRSARRGSSAGRARPGDRRRRG